MKVMTILGTRPEIIRLSRVVVSLDKYMDHILVHTGQNYDYELNQIFFKDLEIRKPDYFLESADKTPVKTIANIIDKSDKLMRKEKPDALLILGDTNSCLSAYSAKRQKIPIFHMEAGNRSFDQRVPEEINRKIVDHISDINLPYSTISRNYLLNEGIRPELIIKTGSPMYEVLNYYMNKINDSDILNKLNLDKQNYFMVSAHREENIDNADEFSNLIDMLNNISEVYDKRIIVSTHPRTRLKINEVNPELNNNIELIKPLGFSDYVKLQINSLLVLSDSGTITEESSILNFPAINIRKVHERPEGMEEGSVILTGFNINRIHESISILRNQSRNKKRTLKIVEDYNTPIVSEKVARIILSYTDYVNRFIWKKHL